MKINSVICDECGKRFTKENALYYVSGKRTGAMAIIFAYDSTLNRILDVCPMCTVELLLNNLKNNVNRR